MSALETGETAPDFTATDTEGNRHQLSELVGQGPVILAFFPKAFTPGWKRELSSYRDRYDEFSGKNATILAISADKEATAARFRREIGAEFAFIPDPDARLIKQFGIKLPLLKLARRTTFVIGKDRRILHVDSGGAAIDTGGAAEACSLY